MTAALSSHPELLLVTERSDVAGRFSSGDFNKKLTVVQSISECHETLARDTRFDAVIVDSMLESAGDDLLAWIEDNHGSLATIRLKNGVAPTKRQVCNRTVDAYLGGPRQVTEYVRDGVTQQLGFTLLVAVPQEHVWQAAVDEAVKAGTDASKLLNLKALIQTDDHLVRLGERKNASESTIESLHDSYVRSPNVRAMLSITGKGEDDFIFATGRRHDVRSWRMPAKRLFDSVRGYPDEAVLLYLVVRSGLTLGAGLPFHRTVSGCPADFCFDLLDFARGMTSEKLCSECKSKLDIMRREGRCGLTRLQVENLLNLLAPAAEFCRSATLNSLPNGYIVSFPGGVQVPDRVIKTELQITELDDFRGKVSENLERMARASKDHFSEYSAAERMLTDKNSFLLAARHYNSDSPTIPGARGFARRSNIDVPAEYIGGGYFLAHRGVGVAIDPGYNFLRILYDAKSFGSDSQSNGTSHGYTTEDIDVVIVTHNHLDHHADLETILRARRGRGLTLCCNSEIIKEYELQNRAEHTQLTLIKCDADDPPFIPLPSGIRNRLSVRRLPALHWQHTYRRSIGEDSMGRLNSHLNTFGLFIELREDLAISKDVSGNEPMKKILITGDTLFPIVSQGCIGTIVDKESLDSYIAPKQWSKLLMLRQDWNDNACDRLIEAYTDFLKAYAGVAPDVACVHIGSLEGGTENDWKHINGVPTLRYGGHHLGLMGAWRLLNAMKTMPKLVLLTEFGEELIGFRAHLCLALGELLDSRKPPTPSGNDVPKILPTDVGFCLDLSTGKIRCSRCDGLHPFEEVSAVELGSDFVEYVPNEVAASERSTCQWREP